MYKIIIKIICKLSLIKTNNITKVINIKLLIKDSLLNKGFIIIRVVIIITSRLINSYKVFIIKSILKLGLKATNIISRP